jgi:hypothetical protein
LSGYVVDGRYFVSEARRELPVLAPFDLAPAVAPAASSNVLGLVLLLVVWTIVMGLLRRSNIRIWP